MIILLFLLVFLATPSWGATRYVSQSGSDSNSCTTSQNIATPKLTFASAVACLTAGDTLYIRGGTWTERINLQDAGITGTSTGWITVAGYPGETVTIRYTDTGAYGAIKARGNRGYFIFENLKIDGVNYSVDNAHWAIRDGNHHFILRNIEIYNTKKSTLYIDASDVTVEDSYFHDGVSAGCTAGLRYYGIYYHNGSNVILRRNRIHDMPGGGIQAYPGPITDSSITDNFIYENGSCPANTFGGMVLFNDNSGGSISNVTIARNVIYGNGGSGHGGSGTTGNTGGTGHGIRLENSSTSFTFTGVKVLNNTIYNQGAGSGLTAYGISLRAGANNVTVSNNLVTGNLTGAIFNAGTGNTITYNACTAAESCGTTGKVSITSLTSCTSSTSVFTLKASSSCIDVGTNVNLAYNGSAPDIGAFETFVFASCEVSSTATSTIRVTFTNNAGAPMLPATGATTFTARKNGASNTVSGSADRVGDNIYDIPVTDAYVGGDTVDISISTNNLTSSNLVGNTTNQPYVETLTNQSCTNNAAGAPSYTFTISKFELHDSRGLEASPIILPHGYASTGAAEDYAVYPVVAGGSLRVRFAVVCGGADCPSTAFYLYYSTGGAYAVVPDTIGAGNVAFCGIGDGGADIPANGSVTTDQLSTAGTFVPGGIVFTSNAIPTITGLNNGYKTELEYCIKFDSDASGTYNFRPYQQSGSALDTYTVTPSITVTASAAGGM